MTLDDAHVQLFDDAQISINRSRLDTPHVLSAPFWGELRVFLAVAKAKSFSGAAEQLNMSTPTVSRQVRRLQDVIGSQLFVTTQNSIQLTPKGVELAKLLSLLDERLFEISRDLAAENRETEGYVRVSATEALAGLFIAPAMSAFNTRYPGIHLHIQNPSNMTNFKENNTDIMVSFMPAGGAVTSQPCGWVHLVPVVGRAYIERYGMPTRDNLDSHLFLDTEYYKGKTPIWQPWQEAVARGVVAHDCDNSFAYGFLIRSGLGIGLLASYALTDSELVPVDLGIHIAIRLNLLALTERLQSRPVRLVYDWLAEVFSPGNGWFGPDLDLGQLPKSTLEPVVQSVLQETD
jgi:DNA-binding transcriptional LysR family regulator